MKAILALDLATQCGHALRNSAGNVHSGSISFACRKNEPPGMRWARYRRFLVDTFTATPDISLIVFEEVKRHAGTDAAHCFGAFRALTELYAANHNIELKPIGVGTWKKHFTGNGAAKKEQIIAICKQLGYKPVDSNEADALGILHVATGNCPLLTPTFSNKPTTNLRRAVPTVQAGQDPF